MSSIIEHCYTIFIIWTWVSQSLDTPSFPIRASTNLGQVHKNKGTMLFSSRKPKTTQRLSSFFPYEDPLTRLQILTWPTNQYKTQLLRNPEASRMMLIHLLHHMCDTPRWGYEIVIRYFPVRFSLPFPVNQGWLGDVPKPCFCFIYIRMQSWIRHIPMVDF